jgi:uncharacterized protein (TIGR01777 family)
MRPTGNLHVLIAGGSGMIGSALRDVLLLAGHQVTVLSRKGGKPGSSVWDPATRKIDADIFSKADVLVNLAGEGIADKPWTQQRKDKLRSSRLEPVVFLSWCLNHLPNKIHTVLQMSATGIYGNSGDQLMVEQMPADEGFLSTTCAQWEAAALSMRSHGRRLVLFRNGIVLSEQGGYLTETLKPVRFGIIPVFGNGTQYISWIHIDDVCGSMLHLITHPEISGVFNVVAPAPVTCAVMGRELKSTRYHNALIVNIPAFVMQLLLGERSQVVLHGQKVSSEKLESTGYQFKYSTVAAALQSLLTK